MTAPHMIPAAPPALLDKLVDAGAFISQALGRPTQSRVAKALLAKRDSAAVCEAV